MRPEYPDLRIALSTASSRSQPCSGAISGRYVALYVRPSERRAGAEPPEESGDGALDADGDVAGGCANEMRMPCTPTVQSRYEAPSSKFVSSEILCGDV